MTGRIFSGDHWTVSELKGLLKKLEKMYAQGVRSSMYKDQRLDFASTRELQQRITDLRAELVDRGELTDANGNSPKRKKQIRITERNRGFRSGRKN